MRIMFIILTEYRIRERFAEDYSILSKYMCIRALSGFDFVHHTNNINGMLRAALTQRIKYLCFSF